MPQQQQSKPALSYSAIAQFLRCPRQYWYQRIARVPTGPKSSALVEGSVGHSTLEYVLRAKMKGKTVAAGEALDYFDNFWTSAIALDDVKWDKGDAESRAKAVRIALKAYVEIVIPTIEPRAVEANWRIELKDCSFDLLGVVDVVDVRGAVFDHKFYARAPREGDIHDDGQLTCYDVARSRGAFGEVSTDDLYLGIAIKGSSRAYAVKTARSQHQREWFVGQVIDVAKAIDKAAFFPNTNGWHCSKAYCDYYGICRQGADGEA